jgi:subtilase family serine protease
MVLVRTNVQQESQQSVLRASRAAAAAIGAVAPAAAPTGVGFGPASLQSAYKLPSSTAGSGQTVAVVDAMDDPNAASDLATYRADWSLPACGSGCFSKVGQTGSTTSLPRASGTSGWATEESLDVDMVSAICPLCHIILVETNSASIANLGAGVNTAVRLGAKYVSNSYGGSESTSDATSDNSFYKHAGVAVTASAGDGGFGVEYPAASQFVTAVGGTALKTSTNARGWTESVWSTSRTEGTGSGCSRDDAKPTWQTDTGCAKRTNNDVAADADPNTGVAVYDTYDQGGFLEVGGTSASSPMIASVFALAGTPGASTFPSSDIYAHTSSLFDVTTGSDGTCSPAYLCTAETGYDGPTGWGTPNGVAAFTG